MLIFDRENFWKHSVAVAFAGKLISKELLPMININPESAFTEGIIHDVGMLVFEQLILERYSIVCNFIMESGKPFVYSEQKTIGTNHATVGLEDAMVFHHNICGYQGENNLVYIIHLADIIANRTGFNHMEYINESEEFIDEACAELYLDRDEFELLCNEFVENREKYENLTESFLGNG